MEDNSGCISYIYIYIHTHVYTLINFIYMLIFVIYIFIKIVVMSYTSALFVKGIIMCNLSSNTYDS